jgi:hypothetical protein
MGGTYEPLILQHWIVYIRKTLGTYRYVGTYPDRYSTVRKKKCYYAFYKFETDICIFFTACKIKA